MQPRDDSLRVVVTTCPPDRARALAEGVVGERLAACCNVLPGVSSTYWWQGALCTEAEALLIFKTTGTGVDALRDFLLARHPYDTPEFVVLPVADAAKAYGAWVAAEVTPPRT
ncbi:MAG: divalent-cation tolerance protein CutA [Candidatus Sericytochromatia bacterium]|nr:divalent-cation tolerance protein CutA [Candidatus Sericytochromatia bacterium]